MTCIYYNKFASFFTDFVIVPISSGLIDNKSITSGEILFFIKKSFKPITSCLEFDIVTIVKSLPFVIILLFPIGILYFLKAHFLLHRKATCAQKNYRVWIFNAS